MLGSPGRLTESSAPSCSPSEHQAVRVAAADRAGGPAAGTSSGELPEHLQSNSAALWGRMLHVTTRSIKLPVAALDQENKKCRLQQVADIQVELLHRARTHCRVWLV